ncbi:MAG: hypothetical protein ACPGQI_04870 [Gammaproteobacteria bacterium]
MGVSGILSSVLPVDYRAGDRFAQSDEMARCGRDQLQTGKPDSLEILQRDVELVIVCVALIRLSFGDD